MRHWTETWLGRPWVAGRHECIHLVLDVQRAHYGRALDWPAPAPSLRARDAQWGMLAGQYAVQVPRDDARDGDVVHMMALGQAVGAHHLGVLCLLPDGERRILHCARGVGTCLHPLLHLGRLGWQLCGYYRPIETALEHPGPLDQFAVPIPNQSPETAPIRRRRREARGAIAASGARPARKLVQLTPHGEETEHGMAD